jgi:hypothetical protein
VVIALFFLDNVFATLDTAHPDSGRTQGAHRSQPAINAKRRTGF